MTTSVIDLEKALLQGVVLSLGGLPLAQENASFEKPANGAPWASIEITHDRPRAVGGPQGMNHHSGQLIIGLYYPVLTGTANSDDKAMAVASYFRSGRTCQYGNTYALVEMAALGSSGESDGYYRRMMSISWAARIARKS